MARLRIDKLETWFNEAAELMARTGMSLLEATNELDLVIPKEECDKILRRRGFLKLLWEARHRYFDSLGKDPNFGVDVLVGRLLNNSQRLEEEGSHDKASEVLLKIAKIRGWVGPESTVSVFGELSQADLDAIRKKLEGESGKARPN